MFRLFYTLRYFCILSKLAVTDQCRALLLKLPTLTKIRLPECYNARASQTSKYRRCESPYVFPIHIPTPVHFLSRHSPDCLSVGCDFQSQQAALDRSRSVGCQNGEWLGRIVPKLAARAPSSARLPVVAIAFNPHRSCRRGPRSKGAPLDIPSQLSDASI
jgi:hypothetical protein